MVSDVSHAMSTGAVRAGKVRQVRHGDDAHRADAGPLRTEQEVHDRVGEQHEEEKAAIALR